MCGNDAVEALAQLRFFIRRQVVPGAALQPHDEGVIGDEMGLHPDSEHKLIGSVGAKRTHLFSARDTRLFQMTCHGGPKIADAGNRRRAYGRDGFRLWVCFHRQSIARFAKNVTQQTLGCFQIGPMRPCEL